MDDVEEPSGMYIPGKVNPTNLSELLAGKKEPLLWLV